MREQEKCPNCGAPPDRHDWRTNEVSGYACGSLPGKSTLKRPMCEYAARLRRERDEALSLLVEAYEEIPHTNDGLQARIWTYIKAWEADDE